MSESSSPTSASRGALATQCPHCHQAYAVHAEHAGRKVHCKGCQQEFIITLAESPLPAGAAASSAHASAATDVQGTALLCPICQSPLGDESASNPIRRCDGCQTAHHAECWDYNKGCGLYGCTRAPETDKLQEVEIPASYWGQTQKACPQCGKVIQAAAVRCRHCGTTFESARPQEAGEFHANQQQKTSMSTHRNIGIAILVAAVIPCTAPLAAVVGVIWYLAARRTIAALPPLHATICRLGVGIAVGMTVLITLIGTLYSHFS